MPKGHYRPKTRELWHYSVSFLCHTMCLLGCVGSYDATLFVFGALQPECSDSKIVIRMRIKLHKPDKPSEN